MTVRCDKCGDESNSAPGLPCGRVDVDESRQFAPGLPAVFMKPCDGTYREVLPPITYLGAGTLSWRRQCASYWLVDSTVIAIGPYPDKRPQTYAPGTLEPVEAPEAVRRLTTALDQPGGGMPLPREVPEAVWQRHMPAGYAPSLCVEESQPGQPKRREEPESTTYVITASIFVEGVRTPAEAAEAVEELNRGGETLGVIVEIRLPDPDSGYNWERVG